MSTDKRDRQRANRARRIEEAEEVTRRRRRRNRTTTYGTAAAVVVVLVVLVVVWVGGDGDEPTDTADQPAAEPAADPDYPATGEDTTAADEPAEDGTSTTDSDFVYGTGTCPAVDGSEEPQLDFSEPQPLCIDPARDYVAVFDTSEGEIRVDLHTDSVPGTVNNFVTLSRWGYYDGTLLFRTDPSIAIIQGGSPHTDSASDPGPGYTISDEPPFTSDANGNPVGPYAYVPGQVVMARSAGFDSAGAQFFFTTGPEASLLDSQGTYVVFGETDAAGLEVLQSIIALHEPGGSLGGAPSRDVTVNSVTIDET